MQRIGTEALRAQFGFICVSPAEFSERHLHKLLLNIFKLERGRIDEHLITTFVAYIEAANSEQTRRSRKVTQQFPIDGELNWVRRNDVLSVLNEKKFHASPAFRKAGNKSTHPPKFLTAATLVLVIGSRRFLMDNFDLYLEQEGQLRESTFELLKDIAELECAAGTKSDDYLHIDIAHKQWYRGNVEALGQLVRKRELPETHETEDEVLSTSELAARIGLPGM
jgi:hypothetical protein